MAGPDISVVVPTLNRETRLAFLLDALAEQTLDRDRFEVLVVRAEDAATGPLTEAPAGIDVRFLTASRGAALQRNRGWRAARSELIAFTDDDCLPAPDWLERILDAAGPHDLFIQGRTVPDPDELAQRRGLARTMEVQRFDPWAPTCNMAYPRALLERVDGFDDRFVAAAWGEDTDLAMRAREAGGRQEYREEVLVRHAVHTRTLPQAMREGYSRSALPVVVARHPQMRRALHFRVFLLMSHALLVLGFAGLVLGRRRPLLGMLAFAPYVRHHVKDSGASPLEVVKWIVISGPRAVLADASEMAGSAVQSVRHRSLVL